MWSRSTAVSDEAVESGNAASLNCFRGEHRLREMERS